MKTTDALREAWISLLAHAMLHAPGRRSLLWLQKRFYSAIKSRSPQQVARMERERGLLTENQHAA